VCLHYLPHWILGQLADLFTRPVTVLAFTYPVIGVARRTDRLKFTDCIRGLLGAIEWRSDDRGQRQICESLTGCFRLLFPKIIQKNTGGPTRQHPFGIGFSTPMTDEDQRGHLLSVDGPGK
jgi:hypothetical protein